MIMKCDSHFITKCDKSLLKMRQLFIIKCESFITKCDYFITKCEGYYKMRRYKRLYSFLPFINHGFAFFLHILIGFLYFVLSFYSWNPFKLIIWYPSITTVSRPKIPKDLINLGFFKNRTFWRFVLKNWSIFFYKGKFLFFVQWLSCVRWFW